MSTIAERARAEADEAEAENPDAEEVEPITGDDEEAEAAEVTPQPEPMTEARMREITKKIEGEDNRHEKRLREIYGDSFGERVSCPLCLQEGFVLPMRPEEVDPMQRMAILQTIGDYAAPDYREHPTEKRCETCDGLGEMLNGSRREGMNLSACQDCMGTGHRVPPAPVPAYNGQHQPQAWTPPPPAYDPAMVNRDPWGRDTGNPNYGQDPATNGGVW